MTQTIIAPSVLSMDFSKMNEQSEALNRSKAEWLHFDVMDGHFVPNLTFGPDLLKGFKKSVKQLLDVHLMITDPEKYAPVFRKAGADCITFHTEALDNDCARIEALMKEIKKDGCMSGFVVKPGTPIEFFESLLPAADVILIMSVEPGFGGQSFMEDMLEKVRWLKAKREEYNLSFKIEIDGGINDKTYQKAVDAGVDVLVAGSYVFKDDIPKQVESLLQ